MERPGKSRELGYEEASSGPRFRISGYDAMPPFLMSLPSDSDLWLFVSSCGALAAGRKDPDHALFPYYNDDRIHESAELTGSKTILRVSRGEPISGGTSLWEPFSRGRDGTYRITRTISKSAYGNEVSFEERNDSLSLSFSYSWATSERFGLVRRARIENLGREAAGLELLDGIQNLMPSGLTRRFQAEFSTLADGYRYSEAVPGGNLALFRLSSIPTDRAEPNEALGATTAWSRGLGEATVLLSAVQADAFRRGEAIVPETRIRGRKGAYLVRADLALLPGEAREWIIVADVDADAAGVGRLLALLEDGDAVLADVAADVAAGTEALRRIVAGVDGLQATGDRLRCWRHYSNALFNAMRGGYPADGYEIKGRDFAAFAARSSRALATRAASLLSGLPERLPRARLVALAEASGDPDLVRLAREYLPLTFSRRHGDPSRPWNSFSIETKDASGSRIIGYEGNWRDIFQNWEALGLSYPRLYDGMLFKFLDASTADGYNPYRITLEGIEWEVIDEDDAWSFIGYWGDHQAAYLLRLLEAAERFRPGELSGLLGRRLFTYAQVPYRIKGYRETLADPRSTVGFDESLHAWTLERAKAMGADGKLLRDSSGAPYRAGLAEKLLVPVLAKLSNYVLDAGIWMNTQRPEWNDANNALVGYGVSVVTACYLRRLVGFCRRLFASSGEAGFEVSLEVARLARNVETALREGLPAEGEPSSGERRKSLMDALGEAGGEYRSGLYERGLSGAMERLEREEALALCDTALAHLDRAIRANRRPDGLYHAYNVLRLDGAEASSVEIGRLSLMLEGQVAVLSSGALGLLEAAELMDALRASELFRPDQGSYLLYPDRWIKSFLEANVIPEAEARKSRLIPALLERGDSGIVVRDLKGGLHFGAGMRNERVLAEALERLIDGGPAGSDNIAGLAEEEGPALLELYEDVFDHRSFTGRSGSFCKYEGLGCVYWHMVSKLLVSVGEAIASGGAGAGDAEARARLESAYREIREGLGAHKDPEDYGAFPTDPYSHTPSFIGVQQPGMTGQAKEDLISRLAELGARIEGGRLSFAPSFAARDEPLDEGRDFRYVDALGSDRSARIEAGSYAFTICQVLVVAHCLGATTAHRRDAAHRRASAARVEVTRAGGSREVVPGLALDEGTSASVFDRSGVVLRLDVFFENE